MTSPSASASAFSTSSSSSAFPLPVPPPSTAVGFTINKVVKTGVPRAVTNSIFYCFLLFRFLYLMISMHLKNPKWSQVYHLNFLGPATFWRALFFFFVVWLVWSVCTSLTADFSTQMAASVTRNEIQAVRTPGSWVQDVIIAG